MAANNDSDVPLTPEHVKPEDRAKFMVDELKIRVETYRSYINLVLQINVFFYVTAGAVLGFYLKNPNDQSGNTHLEYFLWLPILISAVLGGIFFHAAGLQKNAAESIERIRQQLKVRHRLDIEEIPDIDLLRPLLLIFGTIFFMSGAALILVPSISKVTSLPALINFPDDLKIFGGVGLAVLVGGGGATNLFLYILTKRAKAKRTKDADNSTAAQQRQTPDREQPPQPLVDGDDSSRPPIAPDPRPISHTIPVGKTTPDAVE